MRCARRGAGAVVWTVHHAAHSAASEPARRTVARADAEDERAHAAHGPDAALTNRSLALTKFSQNETESPIFYIITRVQPQAVSGTRHSLSDSASPHGLARGPARRRRRPPESNADWQSRRRCPPRRWAAAHRPVLHAPAHRRSRRATALPRVRSAPRTTQTTSPTRNRSRLRAWPHAHTPYNAHARFPGAPCSRRKRTGSLGILRGALPSHAPSIPLAAHARTRAGRTRRLGARGAAHRRPSGAPPCSA